MKQCKKCGTLMNDIVITCPQCGVSVDFDQNNQNELNQISNQSLGTNEISYNFEPKLNRIKRDRESNQMILIIIAIILALACAVAVTYFIFSNLKTKEPKPTPNIELTTPDENPNQSITENPTTTEHPEEPNPEAPSPEEPTIPENTYEEKYGYYTFSIPANYKTSSYQDSGIEMGITLLDEKTGASISFMPGVNTLEGYKEQEQSLTTSMEADGTIVNKIETRMIKNHEIYLLELIQGELHYIMAITPIESKDNTMIMFISDYSKQTSFNYDILNDAINILDNIKVSQSPQIID